MWESRGTPDRCKNCRSRGIVVVVERCDRRSSNPVRRLGRKCISTPNENGRTLASQIGPAVSQAAASGTLNTNRSSLAAGPERGTLSKLEVDVWIVER